MSKTMAAALAGHTEARNGGGGPISSLLAGVLEALASGRQAEVEYKRQIARGVDPSTAARNAFKSVD